MVHDTEQEIVAQAARTEAETVARHVAVAGTQADQFVDCAWQQVQTRHPDLRTWSGAAAHFNTIFTQEFDRLMAIR